MSTRLVLLALAASSAAAFKNIKKRAEVTVGAPKVGRPPGAAGDPPAAKRRGALPRRGRPPGGAPGARPRPRSRRARRRGARRGARPRGRRAARARRLQNWCYGEDGTQHECDDDEHMYYYGEYKYSDFYYGETYYSGGGVADDDHYYGAHDHCLDLAQTWRCHAKQFRYEADSDCEICSGPGMVCEPGTKGGKLCEDTLGFCGEHDAFEDYVHGGYGSLTMQDKADMEAEEAEHGVSHPCISEACLGDPKGSACAADMTGYCGNNETKCSATGCTSFYHNVEWHREDASGAVSGAPGPFVSGAAKDDVLDERYAETGCPFADEAATCQRAECVAYKSQITQYAREDAWDMFRRHPRAKKRFVDKLVDVCNGNLPPPPVSPAPSGAPAVSPAPSPAPGHAFEGDAPALEAAVFLLKTDYDLAIELYGPVGTWNVSGITDMSGLFRDVDGFNGDIGDWDVSSVTTMAGMFASNAAKNDGRTDECDGFDQFIGFWDVSSVTDMRDMFRGQECADRHVGLDYWGQCPSCVPNGTLVEGMLVGTSPTGWLGCPAWLDENSGELRGVGDAGGPCGDGDAVTDPSDQCFMELFPDADACSESSQLDGAHCGRTLDGQNDTGWQTGWWNNQTINQWIAYDLKANHTVMGVCLVWDWDVYGIYEATSVRVDTSNDGSSWTEGATYDEADGMLAGDGDPSSLPDVMEACFAISPVETQHVRLFFEHDDVKLGVAEVRFVELRAIALEEADNCLTLRGTLGPTPSAYSYIFEADPTGAPTADPAPPSTRRLGAGAIDEESAFEAWWDRAPGRFPFGGRGLAEDYPGFDEKKGTYCGFSFCAAGHACHACAANAANATAVQACCAAYDVAGTKAGKTKDARHQCAEAVVDYCEGPGLNDTACAPSFGEHHAPCEAFAARPLCERSACSLYRREVLEAYGAAKAFRAGEHEWVRRATPGAFGDDAYAPPPWDAIASPYATTICGAANAKLLYECTTLTIDDCNAKDHWGDEDCKTKLSTCGDGLLTWGEECEGKGFDGCHECEYDVRLTYCHTPGEPCEACYRAHAVEVIGGNSRDYCPMCKERMDLSLGFGPSDDLPSPCEVDACLKVTDLDGARACDAAVAEYCGAVGAVGGRDPGCEAYAPQAYDYALPQVANDCAYQLERLDFAVSDDWAIVGAEVLVVTCEFIDEAGVLEDLTPYIPYVYHPTFHMSDEKLAELGEDMPEVHAALTAWNGTLPARYGYRDLFPMTEVALDEVYEYGNVDIYEEASWDRDYGRTLHRGWESVARLVVKDGRAGGDGDGDDAFGGYYYYDEYSSDWDDDWYQDDHCDDWSGRALVTLPPCARDPMAHATDMLARRLKWGAVHDTGDRDSQWSPYGGLPTGNVDCELVPGTYVGATIASWIYADWDGTLRKEVEWIWGDGGDVRVDEALEGGGLALRFGEDAMFASGCADTDCAYAIESCATIELAPRVMEPSAAAFHEVEAELVGAIDALMDVRDWGDLSVANFRIAQLAASAAYKDALDLVDELLVVGEKTTYLSGVEDYCPHDYHVYNATTYVWDRNPAWQGDPCCNWELRRAQCCRPADVPNGFARVVESADVPALRTRCTNASVAEMLGKLPQIMESVNGAAACAEALASGAASETNKNQFDEFWRFRDECRDAIENGEDSDVGNACETADDCYCSYSTCETESWSASKVCQTTTEDFVKCEAECYGSKIDAVAMRFLKQDWNVSATDDAGYVDAFVARMTDDHCIGDRQWEDGINSPPGVRWVCDRQCQMDNACDSWTLVDAYRAQHREHCEANGFSTPECFRPASCDDWSTYDWETCEHWSDFYRNADLCAFYGGNLECTWENADGDCGHHDCKFPPANTPSGLPCDAYDQCREAQREPCETSAGCEAAGGTWYNDQSDEDWCWGECGQCCPAGAHVSVAPWDPDYEQCTWKEPGFPDAHELGHPTCCAIYGGSWRQEGDEPTEGACCYGEFMTWCDWGTNDCHTYCNEHASFECWDEDACDQDACADCHDEQDCCGDKFVPIDAAKCESFEACNSLEYREVWGDHHGEACDVDEGWCGMCYGTWCYEESEPTTCYWSDGDLTEADCAALGGAWDEDSHWLSCARAVALTGDPAADGAACFAHVSDYAGAPPAADACPSPTHNDDYIVAPAYPWHGTWCSRGCYYTAPVESWDMSYCGYVVRGPDWELGGDVDFDDELCSFSAAESECSGAVTVYTWPNGKGVYEQMAVAPAYESGGAFRYCTFARASWTETRMDCEAGGWYDANARGGEGACRETDELLDAGACEAVGGALVPHDIYYRPGRFGTEAQCNEGECRGFYAEDEAGELRHQWGGYTREQCAAAPGEACDRSCQRCMSENDEALDDGLCFNAAGVVQVGESKADCFANEASGWEWADCASQATYDDCYLANDARPELQCAIRWDTCTDEAACDAAGTCDDQWWNRRELCGDAGWAHGDTCWAHYDNATTVTVNGTTTTTYEWIYESCDDCKRPSGVCVEDFGTYGCERYAWHQFGCKVFGSNSPEDCEARGNGATWRTPSATRAECEAATRCEEEWYGASSKSPEECEACGGTQVRAWHWHGGQWSGAYVRDLTWFPRVEMAPLNVVTPRTSSRKIDAELGPPLMRAFAASQRSQLYLTHTMWSAVVMELLCECGDADPAVCGAHSGGGAVAGKGTGFCGLEEPLQAGCASAIFTKDHLKGKCKRKREKCRDIKKRKICKKKKYHGHCHWSGKKDKCRKPKCRELKHKAHCKAPTGENLGCEWRSGRKKCVDVKKCERATRKKGCLKGKKLKKLGCAWDDTTQTCAAGGAGEFGEGGGFDEAPADDADNVDVAFSSMGAGEVPGARRMHADGCWEATTRVDAYVVESAAGVVVGQLAGDGVGVETVAGSFESAKLCLPTRADLVGTGDLAFSRKAIVRYDAAAAPAFAVVLAEADLTTATAAKFCGTLAGDGVYFPAYVADDLDPTNDAACAAGGLSFGFVCVCYCGFSGAKCDVGCENSCSMQGTCGADPAAPNACACAEGYSGADCGVVDCPGDAAGHKCHWQGGTCLATGACECNDGYSGAACDVQAVRRSTNVDFPERAYEDDGETDTSIFGGLYDMSPAPTPAPSPAPGDPTARPTTPRPSAEPTAADARARATRRAGRPRADAQAHWKKDKCKESKGDDAGGGDAGGDAGGGSCKDNTSEKACNRDALGCQWKKDKCKESKGDDAGDDGETTTTSSGGDAGEPTTKCKKLDEAACKSKANKKRCKYDEKKGKCKGESSGGDAGEPTTKCKKLDEAACKSKANKKRCKDALGCQWKKDKCKESKKKEDACSTLKSSILCGSQETCKWIGATATTDRARHPDKSSCKAQKKAGCKWSGGQCNAPASECKSKK
ncbi:tenascin-like protein [Aureococcus anophagefferens]|uniref:Tenascin-like protein n=1 Tax=Aureococcus anophagefferens TaxID=44056 RepID=A0ABR1GBJ6_AURAN